MAKKNAAASTPFPEGSRVKVRPGVSVPEFPEVSCAAWTGTVVEKSGKKEQPTFVVEWDGNTLQSMPLDYRRKCEEGGFYYGMACFSAEQLELC